MDRRVGVAAVLVCLTLAVPQATLATNVVCTINNGNNNGYDGRAGAPNSDNPDTDGPFGPSSTWHDASIREWCFPPEHYDQFRDDYLKWSQAAINYITTNNAWHNLEVEQDVYPDDAYNNNSEWIDSNLPWDFHFVSNVPEQVNQHYEESWIVVAEPRRIVANTNCHSWQKWLQEADGQFLDGSPLMEKVLSKVEWTDEAMNNEGVDKVGRMNKIVANNS